MDGRLQNFLYRRPELYEQVYSEFIHASTELAQKVFAKHLPRHPKALLDVGCGTGVNLNELTRPEDAEYALGVDVQEQLLRLARSRFPHLSFLKADMRGLDTGKEFDAIVSFGYALANLHSNADLDAGVQGFAQNSRPGTLLVFDLLNPVDNLHGERLPQTFQTQVDGVLFSAETFFQYDARAQLLLRHRTWTSSDDEVIEDFSRYRLLFPQEVEMLLHLHGFDLVELANRDTLEDGDFSGPYLLGIARRRR